MSIKSICTFFWMNSEETHIDAKVHSAFVRMCKTTAFAFCMMNMWRCREYGGC